MISLYQNQHHQNTLKKFYGYIFINIYIFGKISHKISLRVRSSYVGITYQLKSLLLVIMLVWSRPLFPPPPIEIFVQAIIDLSNFDFVSVYSNEQFSH